MTRHFPYALRLPRAALGLWWLVLAVILFGSVVSSIGGTSSHGLAAFPTALHASLAPLNTSREHVHAHAHDDEAIESAMLQGAAADHPHHGADHSHDKAHVLPALWSSAALPLAGRFGRARSWIEMLQASRLERPPMMG